MGIETKRRLIKYRVIEIDDSGFQFGREQGIGNRESGIGNRESGIGEKSCLPHNSGKRYS
ncbi:MULTISPECIES: hypothetical protein [unclassified Moorena]|uniref:hypothetical protein n=1 Tax=unclassified Moorena TaxID=2683338 RepID=UPI001401A997|nr:MULTISPECIES: hypothetical protein [unclassified Moorena]NEO12130.1 hypothetical protein [Moorena sp. SIO3E8]NEQ02429.1 hypothetical protein [Moorena sp. SIO3F7]